ncbi:MAG TPA: ATP-binding protein [Pseudolabrys sp.]|nr:ATP-binding protein [Pseudolabrys sp.]
MIGLAEIAQADEVDWRNLMGAVPDAVIISNNDGRIVYVNPAVEGFFGYRPEQLLGQPVDILVPRQYQEGHTAHRAEFCAAPRRRSMGYGSDLRAMRADGTEFPAAISLGFSPTSHGNLVIAIVQDLSELRKRDKSIQALHERAARNSKLKEVNKELEAFSFSVSHDLRAPLRVVDGFSQVLLEDYAPQLDAYGKNCLTRIRTAAQRMGQLIDDLLKLARITTSELNTTDVNLTAMTQEVIKTLKSASPERQVEYIVADHMTDAGDSGLLRIVLENLLSNALKFTAGRTPARIEVGFHESAGRNVFHVCDNGAGFDMAYSSKLFGAFQRLHNAKNFPGTGIGLATVQRIVTRHGGKVWAEAEPDKGATIYFTLFQETLDE